MSVYQRRQKSLEREQIEEQLAQVSEWNDIEVSARDLQQVLSNLDDELDTLLASFPDHYYEVRPFPEPVGPWFPRHVPMIHTEDHARETAQLASRNDTSCAWRVYEVRRQGYCRDALRVVATYRDGQDEDAAEDVDLDMAMLDNEPEPREEVDGLVVLRVLRELGPLDNPGIRRVLGHHTGVRYTPAAVGAALLELKRAERIVPLSVASRAWCITPVGLADLEAAERQGGRP